MRNKKLQVDLSSKIASFNSNNSNNTSNNSNNNNGSLDKNLSPSVTDKSTITTTPLTSLTSRRHIAVQSIPTTCTSVGVQCMLTTSNQDPSPTVRVVCGDGGGGVKTLSKSDAVSLKSSVVVSSKKTTTTTPRRPLAVINGNQAANTPVVSYIEIMLFFL